MSSRTFPIHPKNRDLYGPEVYTQSNANTNGVYAFVFHPLGACWRRKPQSPLASTKEMWAFFCGFFALLDRGRVWIVGTEDDK